MSDQQHIIERFQTTTILVVGDLMLDEYLEGSVERISPEAPVPVVVEKGLRHLPGGAGNVVQNLRALGARVLLAGSIGDDREGERLREIFKNSGVAADDMLLLAADDRPTTRKTRIMAGSQQICRLDREGSGPLRLSEEEAIEKFVTERIDRIDGIIFSDYDKGVITPGVIARLVALAAKRQLFITVDPQVTHFQHYRHVGVLTPNHHEAGRFLGRRLDGDVEVEAAGSEILQRLEAAMVLITRGEKGMSLIERDRERPSLSHCHHIPTRAREVFDVTGAGDTVTSIFALAMAAGASGYDSARMSNTAAGIVVGRVGAATITSTELLAALELLDVDA